MAESTRVQGAVVGQPDCKERVALELMEKISGYEQRDSSAPRRYFLELYYQCLVVVNHNPPSSTLQERPRNG